MVLVPAECGAEGEDRYAVDRGGRVNFHWLWWLVMVGGRLLTTMTCI